MSLSVLCITLSTISPDELVIHQQTLAKFLRDSGDANIRAQLSADAMPLVESIQWNDFLDHTLSAVEWDFLISLLRLLRNLCAAAPAFQLQMCTTSIDSLRSLAAHLHSLSSSSHILAMRALMQLLSNMITDAPACQDLVLSRLFPVSTSEWAWRNTLLASCDKQDDTLMAACLGLIYNCCVKSRLRLDEFLHSTADASALITAFAVVSSQLSSSSASKFSQSTTWIQLWLQLVSKSNRFDLLLAPSMWTHGRASQSSLMHALVLILEHLEGNLPASKTSLADSAEAPIPLSPLCAERTVTNLVALLNDFILPPLSPLFARVLAVTRERSTTSSELQPSPALPVDAVDAVSPTWMALLNSWSQHCNRHVKHPALSVTSSTSQVTSAPFSSDTVFDATAATQLDALYLALETLARLLTADLIMAARFTRWLVLQGLGAVVLQLLAAASALDQSVAASAATTPPNSSDQSPFDTPEFSSSAEAASGQGASRRAGAVSPPGLKVLCLRLLCLLSAADRDLVRMPTSDSAPNPAEALFAKAVSQSEVDSEDSQSEISAQQLMQGAVADSQAIGLLLQQTAIDATQPYAREWAVLATRLLSETDSADAARIRQQIEQLQLKEVAHQEDLRQMHLKAEVRDQKLSVRSLRPDEE